MTAYRIVRTLLDDPLHCQALVGLLDDYARDPMGGGTALSAYTREHLMARLRERTDFVSFLAFDGEQAIGLVNGFEGFSTFAARPLLNIHALTVRADYGGRGIARLLIDEATRRCRCSTAILTCRRKRLRGSIG